jgi:hypothetical protein
MTIVAPHVRKHLSADALFHLVHSGFASLPDHRLDETEIAFTDALMSAFAMFSLKAPSLLPLTRSGPRAMCLRSMALRGSRVTHTCAQSLTRAPPRCSVQCSRVASDNFSVVQHVNRCCCLMATLDWHSMGRRIFPPRRFPVARVCPKSTVMVQSRMALVGFQGRGCADIVPPDLGRALLREALRFQ